MGNCPDGMVASSTGGCVDSQSNLSNDNIKVKRQYGRNRKKMSRGGGLDNPIIRVNLQALPGQFIFKNSGQPYTGPYHIHKNGEYMIGVGKLGVNHKLIPSEIIVPV